LKNCFSFEEMKKATAFFLTLVFLISNSGMAVNIHWCGGKISSIIFNISKTPTCKCGVKVMKPKCCKEKTVTLKGSEQLLKTSNTAFKPDLHQSDLTFQKNFEGLFLVRETNLGMDYCGPLLFKSKVPIYILAREILI